MTQTIREGRARLGAAYWRLWWANSVSSIGDGAFATALPLLAVALTRDPRLIAVVTAATYLPWLLFSLHAGVLVDRRDRVRLMRWAQVAQGLVLLGLTIGVITHAASIGVIVAGAFGVGCAQVVFANAAQSVLPSIVPADLLPRANGTQFVVQTVGEEFVGPPLGSTLFAAGAALPFGAGAGAFAAAAALLARVPRVRATAAPAGGIGTGLRWLLRHRLLRTVAVLLGVNTFCNQMGQATLVLLITQTLHVGSRYYGVVLAASAIGSVIGGLVNPVLTRLAGTIPSLIMAMGAICAIYAGIGLAPGPVVVAALMVCNGFAVTMWNVVTVTLRQRAVPDELLGRVNSAYRMLGWGLMPLGAMTGGFVAHAAGLRAPYPIGGVLCAVALLTALPVLLRERRSAMRPGAAR